MLLGTWPKVSKVSRRVGWLGGQCRWSSESLSLGGMAIGFPGESVELVLPRKAPCGLGICGLLKAVGEGCGHNYLHGIEGLIPLVYWANPFLLGIASWPATRV